MYSPTISTVSRYNCRTVKRLLFSFMASASFILLASVLVIWVRSYWVMNDGYMDWYRVARLDENLFAFEISRGGIDISYLKLQDYDADDYAEGLFSDEGGPMQAGWESAKATEYPTDPNLGKTVAGFGWFYESKAYQNGNVGRETKMECVAPLWSLTFVLALLPAAWLVLAWRRGRDGRWQVGHCSNCGYDLRASPEICPECGGPSRLTRVDQSVLSRLHRRTLLAAGLGAAFVPCLGLLLVAGVIHQWRKDRDAVQQFQHILELDMSLCEAAQQGDNDAILRNLNDGARIDARGRVFHRGIDTNRRDFLGPPLLAAMHNRHLDTAKLLLTHGANINAKSQDGETPLHDAVVKYNAIELVLFLLDHGASIDATGADDETPLHEAVRQSDLEMVRLLIAHGANVNAKSRDDQTPLYEAVATKNLDLVRFLIDKGADVNAKNSWQKTPLALAAACERNEEEPIALFLIAHGADINAQNGNGESVLEIAVRRDQFDLAEQLVARGVNVNTVDHDGETPLSVARKDDHPFMEKLLIKNGAK